MPGAQGAGTDHITVLCVDDHRLMREGIVALLRFDTAISVVAEAGTGEEAIRQFIDHRPSVTLMDLQLRGMSGLHAIRAIRRVEPDARIVVLTMDERDESVYHAIQAGAAAYLQKDSVAQDLIRVIREVYAGHQSISPDIESKLKQPSLLSIREIDVLERLAKGMRNKEISISLQISEEQRADGRPLESGHAAVEFLGVTSQRVVPVAMMRRSCSSGPASRHWTSITTTIRASTPRGQSWRFSRRRCLKGSENQSRRAGIFVNQPPRRSPRMIRPSARRQSTVVE